MHTLLQPLIHSIILAADKFIFLPVSSTRGISTQLPPVPVTIIAGTIRFVYLIAGGTRQDLVTAVVEDKSETFLHIVILCVDQLE